MFGALGEALSKIADGIVSIASNVVNGLKDFFMWIVDAVKAVAGMVWDFFSDPIGSIVSAFDWVIQFFKGLLDGILNVLKTVFMPSDGFFDKQFSILKGNLDKKINITEYENSFNRLKGATRKSMPSPRGGTVFLGFDWSVVSNVFAFVNEIRPYTDPIVRGIMFITLLLYNINNVYKLIRGGSITEEES